MQEHLTLLYAGALFSCLVRKAVSTKMGFFDVCCFELTDTTITADIYQLRHEGNQTFLLQYIYTTYLTTRLFPLLKANGSQCVVHDGYQTLSMLLCKVFSGAAKSNEENAKLLVTEFSCIYDLAAMSALNNVPMEFMQKRDVIYTALLTKGVKLTTDYSLCDVFWYCAYFLLLTLVDGVREGNGNIITAIGTDSFMNITKNMCKFLHFRLTSRYGTE